MFRRVNKVAMPRSFVNIICYSVINIVGIIDCASGWEVSLSIFYLMPIGLIVWFSGKYEGLTAAIVSVFLATYAHTLWDITYTNGIVVYWNAASRLFVYGTFALILSELRFYMDGLEILVTERTASLSNEIEMHMQTELGLINANNNLQALSTELCIAEERERRRFATELHDNLGQNLIFAKMKLNDLNCKSSCGKCQSSIEGINDVLGTIIQDVRSLTTQISPPLLYEFGLEAALEWLGDEFNEKHGLKVTILNAVEQESIPIETSTALFHVIRELFVNVVKHAKTDQVSVVLNHNVEGVQVEVTDAGIGFDLKQIDRQKGQKNGFGLFSIRQRILHMGGTMMLESEAGRGTRVLLQAPLFV